MAFNTRYLGEYTTQVRLDIADPVGGAGIWASTEIDRCIQRAVDDLSRHYPLEAVYEHTIVQDVTAEHWTVDDTYGVFVELANKPIKPESETVTDSSGNSCTRDTDYTMDYINGKIAHIGGGELDSSEVNCHITYKKDTLGIDISAIITNLIRITGVEYPVDKIPQQSVAFSIWNDFMYIGSQRAGQSQIELTDKEHIAIYYEKQHTAPLTATAPSYPALLDEVVCKGAAAYAFLIKAVNCEHQCVVDLATIRTELGLTTAVHTLITAALNTVTDYVNEAHVQIGQLGVFLVGGTELDDTVNTVDNAKDVLANITDDIAELRTAIGKALEYSDNYLDAVAATDLDIATVGATAWLLEGELLINKLNDGGPDVSSKFADYARAKMQIAQTRIQGAAGYIQDAGIRLSNIRAYIDESAGWVAIANGYRDDAIQRLNMGQTAIAQAQSYIGQIDRYIAEAAQYQEVVANHMLLADRYRAEGQIRMAEFNAILSSRAEYRKRVASIPLRQPA